MQKKKDKNLMKTDVKPMKQGLLFQIFHLYYPVSYTHLTLPTN